ncbi:MAG: PAS domain S-box protein [Candidatus Cloacimonetes bacterium]|nr:PAS domain S-box protein [Candidatus Cloacimonadota bacterium]
MRLFLEILYNFGILVSISIISGFIFQRYHDKKKIAVIGQGLLFGIASIIGMLNPVVVGEGLIFDGRSVVISLSALFYGPVAGIISASMPAILRIFQGGSGTRMGVSVITASVIIGIYFHYYWTKKQKKVTYLHLIFFGVLVHVAMLFCTLALPTHLIMSTLKRIWFSVLTAYPLAEVFIGVILLDVNEHWKIKRQLQASEATYGFLINNTTDTIVIISAEGKQIYVSPSGERETGYKIEEVQNKNITELIHPDDLPKVYEKIAEIIKEPDTTQTVEYRHKHKTKGWVHLEAVGKNFLNEPSINGIIVSVRNISERKSVEEALVVSEKNLRQLLELAPDAFFHGDSNGNIINLNSKASEYTGYSKDELFGKNLKVLFEETVLEQLPLDYEALKSGQALKSTRVISRKDGSILPVEMNSCQMPDGTYQTFIRDITERKIAEEALLKEKEQLLVTLRSIGDGVITADVEGRVVLINSIAERLTGWTQKEAEGMLLSEVFNIVNESSGMKSENPVEKALATGEIQELDDHTVLISRNGDRRLIADSGAPIKDKKGSITGVVLVFRDMTEKIKLLEAAQQSQKLESIGFLAGGIAHDFNNLLAGIFGYISLAEDISRQEEVTTILKESQNALDRARSLTHQLLTFSKGGEPVKKLQSLIPFLQETVQFALSGSNVSVEFNIDENLSYSYFDKNQIAQVIDNLVINAKQAMPEGGKIIIYATNELIKESDKLVLSSGNYVKISIKDFGLGIPRGIISKIFDPFFSTKVSGQGLGLAMSFSIIKKHRGLIEVDSKPDQGSIFHVYLPAGNKTELEIDSEEFYTQSFAKGKILIMDDEQMVRDVLKKMLEQIGFEVIAVEDGNKAIRAFIEERSEKRNFQALIFDLTVINGMGGKEAIKQIREIDKDVIAFVSSGYNSDPVISNPQKYGFSDSISKPFNFSELKNFLHKYLV